MGSFNKLLVATVVALTIPSVAAATPLTGEAPQIGALIGESADSLLFDGAGGGATSSAFASISGPSVTVLRPVTDPLSLTLTTSTSGSTAPSVVPLPGALGLLLAGIAAFGVFAGRRKSA